MDETNNIVAFLDILGTKDDSDICAWNDARALDFANPVGIIAIRHPNIRFSVFSDSVIISTPYKHVLDFWAVLSHLDTQWRADHIFVRGGITVGEISWLDHEMVDNLTNHLKNYSGARVYGKALVEAVKLESRSGPGMVFFLSEEASSLIQNKIKKSVLKGAVDVAVLHDSSHIRFFIKTHSMYLDDSVSQSSFEEKRQHKSTFWYFNEMLSKKLSMKKLFEYEAFPKIKEAMEKEQKNKTNR